MVAGCVKVGSGAGIWQQRCMQDSFLGRPRYFCRIMGRGRAFSAQKSGPSFALGGHGVGFIGIDSSGYVRSHENFLASYALV